VEHARCAYCRNPIRARQPLVQLARADMSFHDDCWVTLHATVQQGYVDRVREEGVGSLLEPYQRTQMASWLPEAAINAAVESLTEHLESTIVRDDADV
jgi:hypothetical protein